MLIKIQAERHLIRGTYQLIFFIPLSTLSFLVDSEAILAAQMVAVSLCASYHAVCAIITIPENPFYQFFNLDILHHLDRPLVFPVGLLYRHGRKFDLHYQKDPSTRFHQKLWIRRFEAFRQAIGQDPRRPYTGDDLIRFFDTILSESS